MIEKEAPRAPLDFISHSQQGAIPTEDYALITLYRFTPLLKLHYSHP